MAGEEKGAGRTNNLLNQRRTCCLETKISPNTEQEAVNVCLKAAKSSNFVILIQKSKVGRNICWKNKQ